MNSDHMTRSRPQALVASSIAVLSEKARAVAHSYAAQIHRRVSAGEILRWNDGIGRLYP